MRHGVSIFIPLFLCLASTLHAQQQDVNLQTRNMNVAPVLFQNKSFMANSTYGSKTVDTNTFQFNNVVDSRGYLTNAYSTYNLMGMYPFATKGADLGSHGLLSRLLKVFKTKDAYTKTAYDSNLAFDTRTYPGVRENRSIRGIAQARLDKEGAAALAGKNPVGTEDTMHVMTIDDVRALLNKGK